ncbi:hypothetical protein VTN02DRAFT_3796 [Thermoascus thermophilus]
MSTESVDLVVIGAGWHGLVVTKTFLEVHPTSHVVLLEAQSSIGGVWSRERLYPGLKSNNLLGTYEYSDFPMDEATFGVQPGQHITGDVLHSYFEKYVERFGFGDRIRLNSKVERAERKPDGRWRLTVTQSHGEEAHTVTLDTGKLIVATGVTSQPFLPSFSGQDRFGAPVFHCRDFAAQAQEVLQPGKRVSVLGGTKSAWDVAYACAASGVHVDWIIRESGHGPAWMSPPYVTPLKMWIEKLVTTRFLTWFSPCIWGAADGFGRIRRFLHETWLGRKIVDAFWRILANDVAQLNGYDKHPETQKLKPWISPFWVATSISILNYPTDFYEHVRNGTIRIHVADIVRLTDRTVHLSTGEALSASALICSTGWKATPDIQFLPAGLDRQLGLPWSQDPLDEDLVKQADAEILRRFPRLRDPPVPNPKYRPLANNEAAAAPHPFRLARFIVPPSMLKERSIAFLGVVATFNTPIVAQAQALWTTAYFSDRLPITSTERCPSDVAKGEMEKQPVESSGQDDILWETALNTEFGKFRYPGGLGKRNPDFVFDAIPYVDVLLRDLGLRVHRKSGRLAEWFQPYGPEDYRCLVDEWKAKERL